ncbi:MAG: cytochrome b/b6 domain-containing protein [Actinobacteria bacterium]|nr:MAG: cytochrome b/b6 domain-containing protein [Actinomycetota bacterium]
MVSGTRRADRPRVFIHWGLALLTAFLLGTGLRLHWPVLGGPHGFFIFLHGLAAYALFTLVGLRVYWAFFGPDGPGAPLHALRTGQSRSRYLFYGVLWLVLGLLALSGLAIRFAALPSLALVGALAGGILNVRLVHYVLAWAFLGALALHAYESFLRTRPDVWTIFVPPPPPVLSEDEGDDGGGAGVR